MAQPDRLFVDVGPLRWNLRPSTVTFENFDGAADLTGYSFANITVRTRGLGQARAGRSTRRVASLTTVVALSRRVLVLAHHASPWPVQTLQSLTISNSRDLLRLRGLGALTTVTGNLIITNNEDLGSLEGLDNLQYVGGNLTITGNGRNGVLNLSRSRGWPSKRAPLVLTTSPRTMALAWHGYLFASRIEQSLLRGRAHDRTISGVLWHAGASLPLCPLRYADDGLGSRGRTWKAKQTDIIDRTILWARSCELGTARAALLYPTRDV